MCGYDLQQRQREIGLLLFVQDSKLRYMCELARQYNQWRNKIAPCLFCVGSKLASRTWARPGRSTAMVQQLCVLDLVFRKLSLVVTNRF